MYENAQGDRATVLLARNSGALEAVSRAVYTHFARGYRAKDGTSG